MGGTQSVEDLGAGLVLVWGLWPCQVNGLQGSPRVGVCIITRMIFMRALGRGSRAACALFSGVLSRAEAARAALTMATAFL